MVAYSFQQRFAQPILDGTKIHTIRSERKRHAREGEELQLYTGMRTKHCRLIARHTCTGVYDIMVDLQAEKVRISRGCFLVYAWIDPFARNDGFADWQDFKAFWKKTHPGVECFHGKLIIWGYFDLGTFKRSERW